MSGFFLRDPFFFLAFSVQVTKTLFSSLQSTKKWGVFDSTPRLKKQRIITAIKLQPIKKGKEGAQFLAPAPRLQQTESGAHTLDEKTQIFQRCSFALFAPASSCLPSHKAKRAACPRGVSKRRHRLLYVIDAQSRLAVCVCVCVCVSPFRRVLRKCLGFSCGQHFFFFNFFFLVFRVKCVASEGKNKNKFTFERLLGTRRKR